MIPEEAVTLVGDDGVALEGRLARRPRARDGLVMCHPHSLYGGDMDNPVVLRAVEVAVAAELAPPPRLLVGGYSFGATVAARMAAGPGHQGRLAGVVLIAPPLEISGPVPVAGFEGPILVVAGSRDPFCPRDGAAALARDLPSATLAIIEGADHFFFGGLEALEQALGAWLRGFEAGQAGRRGGAR